MKAGRALLAAGLAWAAAGLPAQSAAATPVPLPTADAPVHFRWAAGGVLTDTPLASGGLVYCISEDRSVSALDESGRILFKSDFRLSRQARLSPAGAGALLIADGGRIIRLNRAGRPGFSIDPGGGGAGGFRSPAEGSDGRLFIAGDEGLSCVSVGGARKWTVPLPQPVSAGPAILEDGNAAIGLADGSLIIFGPFSRKIAESAGGEGWPVAEILPGQGGLAALRADGSLAFMDASGNEHALARGLKAVAAAPGDGAWIVLGLDGSLACLDPDGQELWRRMAGGAYDRLKAYPGRIYLIGKRAVAAYTAKGQLLKEMHLSNNAVPPEVSERGIVYSCGLDWIMYAYRFDPDRPADYGPPPARASRPYGLMQYDRASLEWRVGLGDENEVRAILDEIASALALAAVGEREPEFAAILAAVALSRADADSGRAERSRGFHPEERAGACALLGTLGSTESRETLVRVIRDDPEDAVRAAAAGALGAIGWDGDGYSLAALRLHCGRGYQPGTERLLYAAAGAIEGISRYEGVPPSDDGLATLFRMVEYPAPPFVKARALSALRAAMRP